MSYTRDKHQGRYIEPRRTLGVQTVANSAVKTSHARYEFYEIEPAEVLDVITDDSHPSFEAWSDVGKVRFRFIHSDPKNIDPNLVRWARPVSANMRDYPVRHEVVLIAQYLGEWFWTCKLNLLGNRNHNAYPNISKGNRPQGDENDTTRYQGATAGVVQSNNEPVQLGPRGVFQETATQPLLLNEGDIALEGRYGNAIRLSYNTQNQAPSLLITNGRRPGDFTITQNVAEDVNEEGSVLLMTENQDFGFVPSTVDVEGHHASYPEAPDSYGGQQTLISSGRVILNSKTDEILVYARRAYALVTGGAYVLDGAGTYTGTFAENWVVNAPEMYLGDESATEPIPLGNKLADWLRDLVQAIKVEIHPTPSGPSGPPNPVSQARYDQLVNRLEEILSERNFTM